MSDAGAISVLEYLKNVYIDHVVEQLLPGSDPSKLRDETRDKVAAHLGEFLAFSEKHLDEHRPSLVMASVDGGYVITLTNGAQFVIGPKVLAPGEMQPANDVPISWANRNTRMPPDVSVPISKR